VLFKHEGCLSATQQLDIFESATIQFETPLRKNQKGHKKQPYMFRESRKRI
jgi:hypothetical protein